MQEIFSSFNNLCWLQNIYIVTYYSNHVFYIGTSNGSMDKYVDRLSMVGVCDCFSAGSLKPKTGVSKCH